MPIPFLIPLLMAAGGAGLGALTNKKNRLKGALIGGGLGAAGGLGLGAMGVGGAGAAGGLAKAGGAGANGVRIALGGGLEAGPQATMLGKLMASKGYQGLKSMMGTKGGQMMAMNALQGMQQQPDPAMPPQLPPMMLDGGPIPMPTLPGQGRMPMPVEMQGEDPYKQRLMRGY